MSIPFSNSYVRLPEEFFAHVEPKPVAQPHWIAFNRELAAELGMDSEALDSEEGLSFFGGNVIPPGAEPISMAYAGHQFGGFSPQLGDGRALLLGEVLNREGERRDVQLKGSGPTPFSRRGDGRSALGPVLREYIVSEAMAALGVPTTRALAAVGTGEIVRREQPEPGGVFTRVASSHLRIGTVEFFAARGQVENLKTLVRYALERHYPDSVESENPALTLLENVSRRQASLVARWLGLGFIHGVMNTDNMTLSGETIDYGPCAFMDGYHPEKKFSFIDQHGRYAYCNQGPIAQWNLARLAEALLPLMIEAEGDKEQAVEQAGEVIKEFASRYESERDQVFALKLGLSDGSEVSRNLVDDLLDLMKEQQVDFTLAFRHLRSALGEPEYFKALFGCQQGVTGWSERWRSQLDANEVSESDAQERMGRANPVIIPRNHRVEEVIQAGRRGDFDPFHKLLKAVTSPYEIREDFAEYEEPPQSHEEVQMTFCGT